MYANPGFPAILRSSQGGVTHKCCEITRGYMKKSDPKWSVIGIIKLLYPWNCVPFVSEIQAIADT